MKLSPQNIRHLLKVPPQDQLPKLAQRVTFVVILGYSIFMLYLLFHTVGQGVLFPRTIDPSQVTARQEKVDRTKLDAILQSDGEKRTPAAGQTFRDPFAP